LIKVLDGVGPTLRGDAAELGRYAEELRHTRSELDGYCQEIDQILDRIGFGDTDADASTESN
jgi:hypothetical protein